MKMKEFGPRGGHASLETPLPPWIRQCICVLDCLHTIDNTDSPLNMTHVNLLVACMAVVALTQTLFEV